mgnify:CR=1 FL=1
MIKIRLTLVVDDDLSSNMASNAEESMNPEHEDTDGLLNVGLNAKIDGSDRAITTDRGNESRLFMVVGINTAFNSRKRRDSIRQTWMPRGDSSN